MTPEDPWIALQFLQKKYLIIVFFNFFEITFFVVWLLSRSKLGYKLRAVETIHKLR